MSKMTPRERFLTALRGGKPDRVPLFDLLFNRELFEIAIGYRPESYNARDVAQCGVEIGLGGVWVTIGGFWGYHHKEIAENIYQDEWGTTYQVDPSSWPISAPVDYPIKSREDLKGYVPPDPSLSWRLDDIKAALERYGRDIAIMGCVRGPLTVAWYTMGFERLSFCLFDDPDLLTSVFRMRNDYFMEAGKRMVEAGVAGIIVSDDYGFKTGPFFSPAHFKRFVLPFLTELVQTFVGLGVPVLLHSDGDINALLDDLIATGISGLHPLERGAGMDLAEVKEKYGEKICLFGNVSSTTTLPFGSEEDVEREVRECLEIAAPGGGYVLGSDHSLHEGIPVNNILKMIETAKRLGRYQGGEET